MLNYSQCEFNESRKGMHGRTPRSSICILCWYCFSYGMPKNPAAKFSAEYSIRFLVRIEDEQQYVASDAYISLTVIPCGIQARNSTL